MCEVLGIQSIVVVVVREELEIVVIVVVVVVVLICFLRKKVELKGRWGRSGLW